MNVSGARIVLRLGRRLALGMRAPRKISIEAASRNGHTVLRIYCVTERSEPRRYSHATNVCGHASEMHVTRAIELFGADTSLSDLRVVCSVCGGRNYDAVTRPPAQLGQRWI